jgi:hypothetical protein
MPFAFVEKLNQVNQTLMKQLFALTMISLSSFLFIAKAHAQAEEERTKVQLTVNYGGKSIVTDLNSVSTAITRSYEEVPAGNAAVDTAKTKLSGIYAGSFYLTIDAKKISDDLLRVFAKKDNYFDGTITIVDSYGKNPTRTIKFTKAKLYSYSDQFSTASYTDAYGATSMTLFCKEISINGIAIEQ